MLIPYSTDAPIYHFPWMTIVLIVVNTITFVITGMGVFSHGWLLTYGNGLHPTEWVACHFLHFGPAHLVGNMFFLWAFGIVVEGKLGWQRYLGLYLGIGVIGAMLIQTAMLWYVPKEEFVMHERNPSPSWWWRDNSLYAQDFANDDDDDDAAFPVGMPQNIDRDNPKNPLEVDEDDVVSLELPAGAGGASLIIYGLMAIVLVWAPRNELHCLWTAGFRIGVCEIEYLYFCGFYIVIEILSAVLSTRGFEATSEVGHAVGVITGFGLGSMFVKKNWVDCENWDLFAIMSGKHGGTARVGDWHTYYSVSSPEKNASLTELSPSNPDDFGANPPKKKRKKAKPKLVELDSIEDPFEVADESSGSAEAPVQLAPVNEKVPEDPRWITDSLAFRPRPASAAPPVPSRPASKSRATTSEPTGRVRQFLFEGEFDEALSIYLGYRSVDPNYLLPQEELKLLANGLFKAKAVKDLVPLLDEYIRRFGADADLQRVKLSVLYVKFLKRPTAALKLLVSIKPQSLPGDYRSIYQKVARQAQQMIAEGVTDVG